MLLKTFAVEMSFIHHAHVHLCVRVGVCAPVHATGWSLESFYWWAWAWPKMKAFFSPLCYLPRAGQELFFSERYYGFLDGQKDTKTAGQHS